MAENVQKPDLESRICDLFAALEAVLHEILGQNDRLEKENAALEAVLNDILSRNSRNDRLEKEIRRLRGVRLQVPQGTPLPHAHLEV